VDEMGAVIAEVQPSKDATSYDPAERAFATGPNSVWSLLSEVVVVILDRKKAALEDGIHHRRKSFGCDARELTFMTNNAALLMPRCQEWLTRVRVAEKFVSNAQATGGSNLVTGSHNWITSQTAIQ